MFLSSWLLVFKQIAQLARNGDCPCSGTTPQRFLKNLPQAEVENFLWFGMCMRVSSKPSSYRLYQLFDGGAMLRYGGEVQMLVANHVKQTRLDDQKFKSSIMWQCCLSDDGYRCVGIVQESLVIGIVDSQWMPGKEARGLPEAVTQSYTSQSKSYSR